MKSAEAWCNDLITQLYEHGLIVNFDTRPIILAIQRDAIQADCATLRLWSGDAKDLGDDTAAAVLKEAANRLAEKSLLPEAKP